MLHVVVGALVLAVWASAAAPAFAEGPVIDRAAAMKAPVDELARTALTAASSGFVEVERPNHTGLAGPFAPLDSLHFATAARAAGFPGLCEATTARVRLPPAVPALETDSAYRIVGDLKPLSGMWSKAYGDELARKCMSAGRVIRAESDDFGQTTFFIAKRAPAYDVWLASLALQIAIANAGSGVVVVACDPLPLIDNETVRRMAASDPEVIENRENKEGCSQAAATLAKIPLDHLLSLDVGPCIDTPKTSCLSAYFLRYAYENHQALWNVRLRYQVADRDVMSVSEIRLHPDYGVFD
jgi:hypothetical protein